MDDREVRELVRIRYELRRLVSHGQREEVSPLLARLDALASRSASERAALQPELLRWRSVFRVGP